jgi:trehalose 6-phosphate synthase/phosphatase
MPKIIIVSNRLPVTAQRTDQGFAFTQSTGGLATGLASIHAMQETVWLGWPGVLTKHTDEKTAITNALLPHRMYPVFMTEETYSAYYEGFCNSIIWPLFHYFPHPTGCNHSQWQHYQAVNERFAEAVGQLIQPGDQVWIQDYQLLLLPRLLRQRFPDLSIGFYLHIPFPSPDVFRALLWRNELLKGLLGADLLAFQTTEYATNFLSTVRQVLKVDTEARQVVLPSRTVEVTVIPMSIDYEKFAAYADAPTTIDQAAQFSRQLNTTQVILSADRLDYTKGIQQRLLAFERLLADQPGLIGAVTLVLLVSPSRAALTPYRLLKEQIEEAVARINQVYHRPGWTPVHYRYLTLDMAQMSVLYTVADVALVTPFRDGMNLIAKEYVATRRNQTGVLILSEMAGAAHELSDALLINPYDIRGMADAMALGLSMPLTEQRVRMSRMQQTVSRHDVNQWAACFGQQLRQVANRRQAPRPMVGWSLARPRPVGELR